MRYKVTSIQDRTEIVKSFDNSEEKLEAEHERIRKVCRENPHPNLSELIYLKFNEDNHLEAMYEIDPVKKKAQA